MNLNVALYDDEIESFQNEKDYFRNSQRKIMCKLELIGFLPERAF